MHQVFPPWIKFSQLRTNMWIAHKFHDETPKRGTISSSSRGFVECAPSFSTERRRDLSLISWGSHRHRLNHPKAKRSHVSPTLPEKGVPRLRTLQPLPALTPSVTDVEDTPGGERGTAPRAAREPNSVSIVTDPQRGRSFPTHTGSINISVSYTHLTLPTKRIV